jgi:pyruvate kinase
MNPTRRGFDRSTRPLAGDDQGVEPFLAQFSSEPEQSIRDAFAYLLRRGWVKPGDWLVVVTNVLAGEKTIDSIQMRPVE